jgi:carboxypeptidase C (cathepsin A)
VLVLPLLALTSFLLQQATPPPKAESAKPAAESKPEVKEKPPAVTHHQIRVGPRTLDYTVTAGMMPIRNKRDETEGEMFFVAYSLDGVKDPAERPLMFSFNGGPGSSSVWLQLGALGPKRVKLNDDGSPPPPPYKLVSNENTWLDFTDLVFIDPIGTGYSRAAKPDLAKKFFTPEGDIASVGEFIRMYLTRYQRWTSPLFLVGESYGTFRAAGLSGYLMDKGIALNGVVLVSSVLDFSTLSFEPGNDLPYILYLPSYTATAWYHKKLPADLQGDLRKAVAESEQYAASGYPEVLQKGDQLTGAERKAAAAKLARLTGLSPKYVDQSDLRIEIMHFIRELRRDDGVVVGRLDGRLTGPAPRDVSETPDFDPSLAIVQPPYTATFNQYVSTELGYKSDREYYVLGGGVEDWNFDRAQNRYAETTQALRDAFAKNHYMKLFVGCGYFDLATPFYATDYTLNHLGLPDSLKANIRVRRYEAGHMFYINVPSLVKLKQDVTQFVQDALAGGK